MKDMKISQQRGKEKMAKSRDKHRIRQRGRWRLLLSTFYADAVIFYSCRFR